MQTNTIVAEGSGILKFHSSQSHRGAGFGRVVLGFRQTPGASMNAAVPEPSLRALVHLLSEQALMAMGVPHPQMKDLPPANPQIARFFVDLLALLKDKTEGHRTQSETKELEEMLYQLRMRALDLKPSEAGGNPPVMGV